MSIENKESIQTNTVKILDQGPFYHGTKANLEIGDLIKIGYSKRLMSNKKMY